MAKVRKKAKKRDIDADVLRSIWQMSGGVNTSFDQVDPIPKTVEQFIQRAKLRQIHAVLIMGIRRWHEVRPPEVPPEDRVQSPKSKVQSRVVAWLIG